jgi:hypothetical protein
MLACTATALRLRPTGPNGGDLLRDPDRGAQGDPRKHPAQEPPRRPPVNEHLEHPEGAVVFRRACRMGLEGIISKRLGSRYRSGRSPDWLKFKNPEAPAVKRGAEEDWSHGR